MLGGKFILPSPIHPAPAIHVPGATDVRSKRKYGRIRKKYPNNKSPPSVIVQKDHSFFILDNKAALDIGYLKKL
jgi:hypothetical protein